MYLKVWYWARYYFLFVSITYLSSGSYKVCRRIGNISWYMQELTIHLMKTQMLVWHITSEITENLILGVSWVHVKYCILTYCAALRKRIATLEISYLRFLKSHTTQRLLNRIEQYKSCRLYFKNFLFQNFFY